ncbi:MAG: hypothetical protein WA943_02450 [Parvibaculum sp.]|uniref:hypothetical protein n=1 Tax=Parvibaculum sp. TaxID=2024848 RepID=UPI003C711A6F
MAKRFRRTATLGLALAAMLALAACGTFGADSKYSEDPLYGTGYSDGCGSGASYVPGDPSTLHRDPEGWGKSKAYRAGWKKGFNACKVSSGGQSSTMPADSYGRRNGPSGY